MLLSRCELKYENKNIFLKAQQLIALPSKPMKSISWEIFFFENVKWGRNSKSIDFNFFRKLLIYKHKFCLQYFFLFLKCTVRLLFANILEPEPPPYVPPYNQKPMKDINYILDKRCTFYYCFSSYSHNKWGFMTLIERLLVYLIHQ